MIQDCIPYFDSSPPCLLTTTITVSILSTKLISFFPKVFAVPQLSKEMQNSNASFQSLKQLRTDLFRDDTKVMSV